MTTQQKKVTVPDIARRKQNGERIVMLTAYDTTMARLVDASGVDIILVGDSLGMGVLGYESTLPVTMEEMLHHTRAVKRGTQRALVVGDMPFGTFQGSVDDAVLQAVRMLKEGGAEAVKLEGGRRVAPHVKKMTEAGIPVMGHIGMTPQSFLSYGGFKVQGRDDEARRELLEDARALQDAGVFSIVLEAMPHRLGAAITDAVDVPTIGIGAGENCDGQVLVIHDMLGLNEQFQPKFVKKYANMAQLVKEAVQAYADDVRTGRYPEADHRYD